MRRRLEALLAQSNVLSIHVPLTRSTVGMLGAAQFAALPAGAVLVNTARGPTMDFDALEAALRSGHLAAAGLDVMPVEPPVEPVHSLLRAYRDRDPALDGRLIVTPHSAYWTAGGGVGHPASNPQKPWPPPWATTRRTSSGRRMTELSRNSVDRRRMVA